MQQNLVRRGCFSLLLLLLSPSLSEARELLLIEDVQSIKTYRMSCLMMVGEDPPVQKVSVEGMFTKSPLAHHLKMELTQGDAKPVHMEVLKFEDNLFHRMGTQWGPIDKFNLAEMTLVTPDQLLGLSEHMEEVGVEELHGRKVLRLRAQKDQLPKMGSGSDTIDFSRMESAVLDVWADLEESFIVKFLVEGQVVERGTTMPIHMGYEYSGFNQKMTIQKPGLSQVTPPTPEPPQPSQAEVEKKLGFSFPIPKDSHVAIYGTTVTIVSSMPLEDARTYANQSMNTAGFEQTNVEELSPGEFYSTFTNGDRTLGVKVFQVSERGATIKVNAIK